MASPPSAWKPKGYAASDRNPADGYGEILPKNGLPAAAVDFNETGVRLHRQAVIAVQRLRCPPGPPQGAGINRVQ